MLWDVLIGLSAIGLAMAGWNIGLINSWRGPVAMVVATIATQMFYIDFATWIIQQLQVKPAYAALFAYLMMWLLIEIMLEIAMNLFLTWNRKERPRIYDRFGGVLFALFKWACVCMFPLVAMQYPGKLPEPPPAKDGLINPMSLQIEDSTLIKLFTETGKQMSFLKPLIVSTKEPSFKPNFEKTKVKVE